MERALRARVLLSEADALGLTIDDLVAAAAESPSSVPAGPSVRDYVEAIAPTFSAGTAGTYKAYWRLVVVRLGDRPVSAVTADDCDAVVADAVARAKRRRPGSDGRSSRESCIGALRALFARAERAGLITRSPAADLVKPRRLPNRRRALDDCELREVIDAVRATSRDPDLDLLLIRFHLLAVLFDQADASRERRQVVMPQPDRAVATARGFTKELKNEVVELRIPRPRDHCEMHGLELLGAQRATPRRRPLGQADIRRGIPAQ